MVFDKRKFVVKLYEDLIEVDLKEGAKKELEDVVEAHPALREESLGRLFQTVVPSDVDLTEIDSVEVDDKGQLKLVIPRHKDLIIPLEHDESRKLAKELNELVPYAKSKEAASRMRFPLYFWWPDYYSYVVASDAVESENL